MKFPSNCYIQRFDRLTANEISLWLKYQNSQTGKISPFVTYEFSKAVSAAGRRPYVAFVTKQDGSKYLFPFEYKSFSEKLLKIASRVGGQLSDCMSTLPANGEVAPEDLWACLSALNFDHAPIESWNFQSHFSDFHKQGWILNLEESLDEYWSNRSRLHKQRIANLQNRRRKITKDIGELELFQTSCPNDEQIAYVISRKKHQYQKTNVNDIFSDPFSANLIHQLRHAENNNSQLFFSELRVKNTVAAAHLGLRSGANLHYWFPVYENSLKAYSPGLLLLEQIINHMPSQNLSKIDFGEGDSEYKRLFSTDAYINIKHFSQNLSMGGWVARAFEGVRWRFGR